MRSLWPIEQAAIEAACLAHPAIADDLRNQVGRSKITSFKNTGAGFFSDVAVIGECRRLKDLAYLDCATGHVEETPEAMGFIAFFEDGHLSLIEGYCLALDSTEEINFETVSFDISLL